MLIRDQWDAPKPPVDRWHLRHFGMNPLTQDIGTGNLKSRWLMRGWAARPRAEEEPAGPKGPALQGNGADAD